MDLEVLTKQDLIQFRIQLIDDLRKMIAQLNANSSEHIRSYKTKQVRSLLGCSINKLQSLRISGRLRCKKIGGTVYYSRQDVEKLLNEGF